jgi:hypothetical protein
MAKTATKRATYRSEKGAKYSSEERFQSEHVKNPKTSVTKTQHD